MLLTRSPLGHLPEGRASLDLHVLSTPPAFVLSQDQTLRECLYDYLRRANPGQLVDTKRRFRGLIAGPYELTNLFCSMYQRNPYDGLIYIRPADGVNSWH